MWISLANPYKYELYKMCINIFMLLNFKYPGMIQFCIFSVALVDRYYQMFKGK